MFDEVFQCVYNNNIKVHLHKVFIMQYVNNKIFYLLY